MINSEQHVTYKNNKYKHMKKHLFKFLAKLNKVVLPSFTKRRLDLSKATKLQMVIFGWRLYVTKRALD
jgi:hypothetical protein